MTLTRATATAVLVLRVSYGLALVAAPGRLALRRGAPWRPCLAAAVAR